MEQNRKIVHFQFLTYYLVGKNVGRNFYKERVEFALVPLVEDAAHFVVVHTQHVLHEVVGLADELHVSVLDAVVHHLHKVTRAVLANLKFLSNQKKSPKVFQNLTQSQQGSLPDFAQMAWKMGLM